MLTDSMVAGFVALAGPDFTWAGVRGCSRPASDVRKALRADLANRQGGICPVGGEPLPGWSANASNDWLPGVEFNHIVARGPLVKGFIIGNIFAGCASHNAMTKPLYNDNGELISGVEVITPDMLARPDLIPMEWTPFPILRSASKNL